MSTKTEKDAIYATLFFQIAHYCLRPWPWILVALCVIVLYPELKPEEVKMGYIYAMRDFLPPGLRGMLLVAFLAAYMSTIATQLNWGASYLVNDLYCRFIRPLDTFENKSLYLASAASDDFTIGDSESDKHYILVSRLTTIGLMILGLIVTTKIGSISGAWEFILQCGAGLGLVLILRWYWWRINVWSEISATLAPFVMMIFLQLVGNKEWLAFPNSFLATVLFTTVVWLVVTFLTKPEDYTVLRKFYEKVQPDGAWRPFFKYHTSYKYDKKTLNDNGIFVDLEDFLGGERRGTLFSLIMCWFSSIILIYSSLFFIGKIIFMEYQMAAIFFGVILMSFFTLRFFLNRTQILD
jgi:SSS family solute:Na+ symporter